MKSITYTLFLMLFIASNAIADDDTSTTICPDIAVIQAQAQVSAPQLLDTDTYLALIATKLKTNDIFGHEFVWNIYGEHKAATLEEVEPGIEHNISNLIGPLPPLMVGSLYHLPTALICKYDLNGFYTFNNRLEHDDIFAVEVSTSHLRK